jgi:hypothetical protein
MTDTAWVSLAVTAGILAVAGVPLRAWQFFTGRFRPQIPPHPLAHAWFGLFGILFLALNGLAWSYALLMSLRFLRCSGACDPAGAAAAAALGLLGCAYALLEGFLLTARRRGKSVSGER